MFKNNAQEEKVMQDAMSSNIIGKGSTFSGNIQTHGNIRVEGRIIGDVVSKSKVAIGPSAIIEGNVIAQVSEVEGEVKGSIEVTDLLTLKPKCKILGNIITDKLVVESGAKFEGKCKMGQGLSKIELKTNFEVKANKTEEIKKAI